MLRLIVFDLDGTLVDSLATIQRSMAGAAARLDLAAPDPARVRGVIGLPLREAVGAVFDEAPEETWDALATAYKEAFWALTAEGDSNDDLFPGALDCLEALDAAGFLLGIATGKGRRGLDAVLHHHGLHARFVTLQSSDDGPGKPHPAILRRAMAEAGADAATTVMIGDTTFDMEMAKAAGVAAIGVAWGYHAVAGLRDVGADHIATTFDDLPPAIERLLLGPR
jgi:phosphoglycolate phosphatase